MALGAALFVLLAKGISGNAESTDLVAGQNIIGISFWMAGAICGAAPAPSRT